MRTPALLAAIILSFSSSIQAAVSMVGDADMREAKLFYQLSEKQLEPKSPTIVCKSADGVEIPVIQMQLPDAKNFYVGKAVFSNLLPNTKYEYTVKSANGTVNFSSGSFTTKPDYETRSAAPDFSFAVFGTAYDNDKTFDPSFRINGGDYHIFETAQKANPSFVIWADGASMMRNADSGSKSGFFLRYTSAREVPQTAAILTTRPNYSAISKSAMSQKDICAMSNKSDALEAFDAFWSNPTYSLPEHKAYSFRHSDAEFFVLDDCSKRKLLDYKEDIPQFLGEAQKKWLFEALQNSTAKFKIVVMNSPITNPVNKPENFASAEHERKDVLDFIARKKITGLVFISANKPYGEVTRMVRAGAYPLVELTAGPLTGRPIDEANEMNYFRMPSSGTFKRSFALIEISGAEDARELKMTFVDADGNRGFSTTLRESDLKSFE